MTEGTKRSGATDDSLLAAAAAGCGRSFRLLMERHAHSMLILAARITGNPNTAQEIVQDCFLKTWIAAPQWRAGEGAQFSTWLYRVVLNACLDQRRRPGLSRLEDVAEPADHGPDGFDHSLAQRRRALVRAALDQVPERQRAALCLYYFSELTAPQSAEILDVTLSTVESLLVRGKRSLRAALANQGVLGIDDVF